MRRMKKIFLTCVTIFLCCALCVCLFSSFKDTRAQNTHFTTLEIREGGVDGNVVADLLNGDGNYALQPGKDYYLCVQLNNPAASGETGYVSVDFGTDGKSNGLTFFNPPGGGNLKPGAITHDNLASIYSYNDIPNKTYGKDQTNYPMTDGKIVYTIKDAIALNGTVTFATGLVVDNYYYACESEIKNAIEVECGIIDNDILVPASNLNLDVNVSGDKAFKLASNPYTYNTSLGSSATFVTIISADNNKPGGILFKKAEMDINVPEGGEILDYGVINGSFEKSSVYHESFSMSDGVTKDGMTTYHLTFNNGIKLDSNEIQAYVKVNFPKDKFNEGTYTVTLTNGTITPMNENSDTITVNGSVNLKTNLLDPESDKTTMEDKNRASVYNWTIDDPEAKYNTQLGCTVITNPQTADTPYEKTFEAKYNVTNTAAKITIITLPKGTNSNPTITYTGKDANGVEQAGSIPVSLNKGAASQSWYVFRAMDLGIDEFKSIKYEMGKLPGSTRSPWSACYDYTNNRAGSWGYFTNDEIGLQVKNEYKLYNTDVTKRDEQNGNLSSSSAVTSSTTPIAGLNCYLDYNNVYASDRKTKTNSVTAGDSIYIKDASLTTTQMTEAVRLRDVVGQPYANTSTVYNPVMYLTLPKGMTYSDLSFKMKTVNMDSSNKSTTSLSYNIENVSYLNTTGDGTSIYKVTFPDKTQIGFYDDEGYYKVIYYSIQLNTAKYLSTQRYEFNNLFHLTTDSNLYAGKYGTTTAGDKKIADATKDIYGLNDGNDIGGAARKETPEYGFGVQQLSEIVVTNSITVSTINNTPISNPKWYNYDATDPNSVALLGLKSTGTYRINIHNPSSATSVDMKMFIPIPKKDVDLGKAFMDEQSKFDMNLSFDEEDLASKGFTAKYVKISGQYDSVLKDNVVYEDSSASEANAILLTYNGSFGDQYSTNLDFDFITDGTVDDLNKQNIFRDAFYYESAGDSNGKSLYGTHVATETAGGQIKGKVFDDTNANGLMDTREKPLSNITVTLKDSRNKIYSTTTDDNGDYKFDAVREDTIILTMSVKGDNNKRFNVPSIDPIAGYVTNDVTPNADGLSACKTVEVSSAGNTINGALGSYYILSYNGNNATSGNVPVDKDYAYDANVVVKVKPDNLVRTGYVFKSWNSKADGTGDSYQPGSTLIMKEDKTLYATWTLGTFTIIFNYNKADGNIGIGSKEVTHLQTYGELPSAPTRKGYTFKGWSTKLTSYAGVNSQTVFKTGVDTTLYAYWTPKTGYEVSYDTKGGSSVDSLTGLNWESNIYTTSKPTKDGYTFDYWKCQGEKVTSSSKYNEFASDDSTDNPLVVEAVYKELDDFSVKYDSDGGTSIDDLNDVSWTQSNLLPSTNPTKEGYVFGGWTLGEEELTNSTKYKDLVSDDSVKSVTIKATWIESKNNTVVYDSDGGTAINPLTDVKNSDTNLLPNSTPKKAGYTFDGWYLDNTKITDTDVYSNLTSETTLTLKAKWISKEYKVNYNLNNDSTMDSLEGLNYQSNNLVPTTTITKSGYSLDGFYYDNKKVTNSNTYASLVNDDSVSEITLVAKWSVNSNYVVQYNSNGGTSVDPISGVKWTDDGFTKESTTTKLGYNFDHWSYNSKQVTDSNKYSDLVNNDDTISSITLDANWIAKSGYTIKYNTDGGNIIEDKTGISWEDGNLLPTNPVKPGYVFDHWICGRNTVTTNMSYGDLADSDKSGSYITLTASYKMSNSYTVKYITNNGTTINDKTNVGWLSKDLLPTTSLVKKGYHFTGWTYGSDKKVITNESYYNNIVGGEEISEIVLEANWEENNNYRVIYNTHGGTSVDTKENVKWSDTNLTAATTLEHCKFIGWSYNGKMISDSDSYADITNDDTITSISLDANWEVTNFELTVENGNGPVYPLKGSIVTITANAPEEEKEFSHWEVLDGNITLDNDKSSTTTFTMPGENVSVKAIYTTKEYSLNVVSGTISAGSYSGKTNGSFPKDTNVSITAKTPATNYHFDHWNIDGDGQIANVNNASTTIKMSNANATVTAIYVINSHDVTINDGSSDKNTYDVGQTVSIEADRKVGKAFKEWKVVSGSVTLTNSDSSSTTFIMPDSDVEITAVYTDLVNSSVSVVKGSGSGNYYENDEVNITAQPPVENYKFKSWKVVKGNIQLKDSNLATTSFIMGNQTVEVEAEYEEIIDNINVSVNNGTGSGTYHTNDLVSIAPNEIVGKEFDHWVINSGTIDNIDLTKKELSFKVSHEDIEITAVYVDKPTFNVEVKDANGSGTYIEGALVNISAPKVDGKEFSHWEVVAGDILINDINKNDTTFILGDKNVVIKAIYKDVVIIVDDKPINNNQTNPQTTTKTTAAMTGDSSNIEQMILLLIISSFILLKKKFKINN